MKARSQAFLNGSSILPSTCFWCGCGANLLSKDHFKDHSLRFHQGEYVDGSSHFLTKYTHIILSTQYIPQVDQTPQNSTLKWQQQLPQKKITETLGCTDKPTLSFKVEAANKNLKKRQKKTQKDRQAKSTKVQNKAISTIITNQSKKTKHNEANEDIIEWNGFRLTKNAKCTIEPYYCGLCSEVFSLPEDFIVHCLDVCQQLKNLQSSHFISCTATQERQDFSSSYKNRQQSVQNDHQQCLSTRFDHEEHLNSRIKAIPITIRVIKKIKMNRQDQNQYCGFCDKILVKPYQIWKSHIKNYHSQIIHPSSSHIIFRYSIVEGSKKIYTFNLSRRMAQTHNAPILYCPCKPNKTMTLEQLFNHIMEVHKGISPYYFKLNKQQGRQEEQRKIGRNPLMNLFSSKDIILKIDHSRVVPFRCQQCNLTLNIRSYLQHVTRKIDNHQNITASSFSHVVLPIKRRKDRFGFYNAYLSPKIEWMDKQPIYYCPCSPNNKVSIKELVEHHIKVHKFMAPPVDQAIS